MEYYRIEKVTISGSIVRKSEEHLSNVPYTTLSGLPDAITDRIAYPRYYIESGIRVQVNDYGQYTIDHGILEIAGILELNNGGIIIVKQE